VRLPGCGSSVQSLIGDGIVVAAGAALASRRQSPVEPGPRRALTGREVEVLRLVATGATNKMIAAELVVSLVDS
jgi:DNA-binding NarL/FixJ family response regulator